MIALPSLLLCTTLILSTIMEMPEPSTNISDVVVNEKTAQTPVTSQDTTETVVTIVPEVIILSDNKKEDATIVASSEEKKVSPITITNAIEPSMLAYKHWTGTYSPDAFTVCINDTAIATGETYTLTAVDTPLCVKFDYSFMNGIRTGSKKIVYQMNNDCTQANMTFSWLDESKIIIDNGTVISSTST